MSLALDHRNSKGGAANAGFHSRNYAFVILAYARMFNGPARGGKSQRTVWTDGFFSVSILSHELGHCYGLDHANLWQSTNGRIDGGAFVEYGDGFEVMGGGGSANSVFNTAYKYQLGWIPEGDVPFVTASGTYRLWTSQSSGGTRALRIQRDLRTYWIEFPGTLPDNPWSGSGILVRLADGRRTMLLDAHPDGVPSETGDAPFLIGQTCADIEGGIFITPRITKGAGTSAYMDVSIQFTSFPNNRPPSLAIAGPLSVASGQAGKFTATGAILTAILSRTTGRFVLLDGFPLLNSEV